MKRSFNPQVDSAFEEQRRCRLDFWQLPVPVRANRGNRVNDDRPAASGKRIGESHFQTPFPAAHPRTVGQGRDSAVIYGVDVHFPRQTKSHAVDF